MLSRLTSFLKAGSKDQRPHSKKEPDWRQEDNTSDSSEATASIAHSDETGSDSSEAPAERRSRKWQRGRTPSSSSSEGYSRKRGASGTIVHPHPRLRLALPALPAATTPTDESTSAAIVGTGDTPLWTITQDAFHVLPLCQGVCGIALDEVNLLYLINYYSLKVYRPLQRVKQSGVSARLPTCLEAWNRYLCVRLAYNRSVALELVKYQTIVVMLFANHSSARCLEYDSLLRQAAARDPWDIIKEDIYVWAITQRHDPSISHSQSSNPVTDQHILGPDLELQRALTPLRHSQFERELINHPDKTWTNWLLNGIKNGVALGYDGPRGPREAHNLISASTRDWYLATQGMLSWPTSWPIRNKANWKPKVLWLGGSPQKRGVLAHDPPSLRSAGTEHKWLHLKEEFSLRYSSIDDATRMLSALEKGQSGLEVGIQNGPSPAPRLGITWHEMERIILCGHMSPLWVKVSILPFQPVCRGPASAHLQSDGLSSSALPYRQNMIIHAEQACDHR